jgi:hypothetical protein
MYSRNRLVVTMPAVAAAAAAAAAAAVSSDGICWHAIFSVVEGVDDVELASRAGLNRHSASRVKCVIAGQA